MPTRERKFYLIEKEYLEHEYYATAQDAHAGNNLPSDLVVVELIDDRTLNNYYPWQIDREQWKKMAAGSAVLHAAMREFYKQVTSNILQLNEWVPKTGSVTMPVSLTDYYSWEPENHGWRLKDE